MAWHCPAAAYLSWLHQDAWIFTFGSSKNECVGLLDTKHVSMTASTRGTYRWRAFVNRSCTSWVVGNHLNIWILRDISRILDVKIRLYIGVFRNFRLHLMARATTGPAHLVMVLVGIRCGFGGGNISIGKLGLLYACFWFILGLFIAKIARFLHIAWKYFLRHTKKMHHGFWELGKTDWHGCSSR